jgi:hypothetical protein
MTLPYNADSSIQSNFNFYTSNLYDGFATSNYVISNVNLKQNVLTAATTLLGVGSSISALDYNKITLNKPTNFQTDWNSTIINKPSYFLSDWSSTVANKPSYFPIDPSIYYNKTETNNLLSAKEQILTFNAPLTRTINTIEINLNSYPSYTVLNSCNYITNSTNTLTNYPSYTVLNSCNYITNATNTLVNYYTKTQSDANYLLKTGGAMTGQITGVTTLNGTTGIFGTISTTNNTNTNTPQLGIYGGTGDKFILYTGTVSVHPYSLGINNLVLWYSVPSTASHIFYASTNLQEAGTNLTSKYLQLSGGTMSGALNITSTTTDNQIVITNTSTTRYTSIKFYNGTTNGYIGIGGAALAGTSYYNNNVFIEANNSLIFQTGNQGTGSVPRMIINTSGNVGIATTNPTELLNIYTSGTNNAYIKVDAGGGTGQSGLRLFAGSGTTNRATRIDLFNNVASTTLARWSILNDTDQNGTNDFRIYNAASVTNVFTILQSGFLGINTTTPKCHLQVIGKGNITNGSEYAITQNFMASGSLTIGGINTNYGCGTSWTTNTAGLLMECSDNTEIAIHDGNTRLASAMAYYGGGTNRIYLGRDMGAGWGSTPITIPNSLTIDTNLYFTNRIEDHILNLWGTANYSFGVNNSTLRYNSDGVHKFYCGGAESSTITNKGIVIGTFGTQYYPFIVNKTINGTLSYVYVRTGWNGGDDYNTNSITGDTSASFAGQIHVSGNILNSSDIRIKKEINDITDDGALQQILAIQPKTYKYIDYLSKGNSNVYGFIAQQVKEVIPHSVETVKNIIPNIYKRASCDSNIITLENDVSQDLNLNDNIKIYDEFGNDNMYNITEINSNVIKIDKDINTSNIFVFGKEVDDFHTLKKDYIFTLNVCATQELYKLIQNQNIIIEDLKNRISILETK